MALFDRLSRVARAELNYAKSQSVNPEQEVERTISMLQDAVLKTRAAIAKTPPDQAKSLRLTLIDLETKLSSVRTPRVESVSRTRMEARLQEINKVTGGDLSKLVSLFEEINGDIAAMKAQLLSGSISR
jgi:phage shock protein A